MPYGELSYAISGRRDIIPAATKEPAYVDVGGWLLFRKDFNRIGRWSRSCPGNTTFTNKKLQELILFDNP